MWVARWQRHTGRAGAIASFRRANATTIHAVSAVAWTRRTADMAGDPFGLLLKQRIVFLGGEVGWGRLCVRSGGLRQPVQGVCLP